ncbi:hypothetical protein CH76_12080 [Lysinibacillus sp. BF-4]|uniref:hypothetical protein n=1 Tax=Lysinibacillus sp. BF-4 TaxID=1473546 RepID=UPI0005086E25|nr:hypothetical protein [Lysinibacillus sp. BF-4]KFL42494.1 hypothetical protein CH76_12080 [Lysinibacillus sp. BF-4]
MVQVYTYDTPEWYQHPQFTNMTDALHICATGNVKQGILEKYKSNFSNVITVHAVIKEFELSRDWYNPENRLQQYLTLSREIQQYEFNNEELAYSFKANKEQVLETIRFLVEAGQKPSDLDEKVKTKQERAFQIIWSDFEKITDACSEHRHLLQSSVGAQKFRNQFKLLKNNTIFLHGFYFITPNQQVFFKYLERLGFQLIFFQYYDERFPTTFDFIKQFINEEYGWSSDWHITKTLQNQSATLGTQFLSGYEDGRVNQASIKKEIIKYPTFFDFLQDVVIPLHSGEQSTEWNEQNKIFAPQAKQLNQLLQTQYPMLDSYKQNFLSHPIGRFLINIHEVWQEGQLKLHESLIMELFSSGWLVDEKTEEDARNYTYDLKQIFPYFKGCETLEQWKNTIEKLYMESEKLLGLFGATDVNTREAQFATPFSNLSYLSLPLERIAQIRKFFQEIEYLAKSLFSSEDGASCIDEHFRKLRLLLQKRRDLSVDTDSLELKLLNQLIRRLENIKERVDFLYDDIHSALYLYLNGKFSDKEDKGEIITEFLEVDGEMFKQRPEKVWLAGIDEHGLPFGKASLPWPLTQQTIEELGKENVAVQLFLNRNKAVKQISRFLFFIALEFLSIENLQCSWLSNRGNHDNLNSTMYVRQLGFIPKLYSPIQFPADKEFETYEADLPLPTAGELASFKQTIDEEVVQMEYLLCPKRFYYSRILQPYSTISEDFVHGFVYSTTFKTALSLSREIKGRESDASKIAEQLTPYFPQFEQYRVDSIVQHSKNYAYRNFTKNIKKIKENIVFPGLTTALKGKLKQNITPVNIATIFDPTNSFEAKPSKNCKYCPHQSYCISAQYQVDE